MWSNKLGELWYYDGFDYCPLPSTPGITFYYDGSPVERDKHNPGGYIEYTEGAIGTDVASTTACKGSCKDSRKGSSILPALVPRADVHCFVVNILVLGQILIGHFGDCSSILDEALFGYVIAMLVLVYYVWNAHHHPDDRIEESVTTLVTGCVRSYAKMVWRSACPRGVCPSDHWPYVSSVGSNIWS